MNLGKRFTPIFHPPPYFERQILPAINSNNMTAEIVWTYLIARKYENDLPALVRLLCGQEEHIPSDAKIWLEVYPHPTRIRRDEGMYWKTRADLAIGRIEHVGGKQAQIRANGDWICIAESKWFDDIHPNARYPNILQLPQLIEHALLLHDRNGKFPERVYVTLVTPAYFKDQKSPFSERQYRKKYREYKEATKNLENDLRLCLLRFLKHDVEMLISRIGTLTLNWITFEDLLGLPNLVERHVPGKYRTTFETWDQVFNEMGRADLLVKGVVDSKTT